MKRVSLTGVLSIFLLGFLIRPCAHAGSFSAVPVKLFMEKKTRSAVLKIVNTGDEKLTLQLSANLWHQDENGIDKVDPTNDIIFFPRIAQVAPGSAQVIRIGYEGPPPGAVEQTYRFYIEELPVAKPGEVAVKIAVRMGIPIFVKPVVTTRLWTIERFDLTGGTLGARIRNGGNTHLIVSALKTTALDDSGAEIFSRRMSGWYVLPGISKKHTLQISRDECLKARSIRLEAEVDGTTAETNLVVDKTMCAKEGQGLPGQERKKPPESGADGG